MTAGGGVEEEYAALITEVCTAAERQLQDARMSLHILLTAQFGELNENQEEMAGAAAAALEEVDRELQRLRTIVELDRGTPPVARESIHVGDVLRSLTPMLRAQAAKGGVRFSVAVDPGLPRVCGDPPRFRDALRLALSDDIRYSGPGSTVVVEVRSTTTAVVVTVRHEAQRASTADLVLAERLVRAQGGELRHDDGCTTVTMPRMPHGTK